MINAFAATTYQAGLLQTRAQKKMHDYFSVALDTFHLSVEEWALLGLLNDRPSMHMHDVAEYAGIEAAAAKRLLQSLVQKGLVRRSVDTADSRTRLFSLSLAGRAMLPRVEETLREHMQQYLRPINPLEYASYMRVLRQIADLP